MSSRDNGIDESAVIIDEIESNLANVLSKKRQGVEREFQERVRKEKEESDRRISQLEEEFSHDKGLLAQFRGTISEYDRARQEIRDEVQSRLEKAVKYQKEIERLTGLTMEELNKVDALSGKLAELRRASEERAAELQARIRQRFGLIIAEGKSGGIAGTPPPAAPPAPVQDAAPPRAASPEPQHAEESRPPVSAEPQPARAVEPPPLNVPERPASERMSTEERIAAFRSPEPPSEMPDLELELRKLKRIKQLLENEGKFDTEPAKNSALRDPSLGRHLNPELPPLPEEPAPLSAAPTTIPEPAGDMKMPEINQIIEAFTKRPPEPVPLQPEPAAPPKIEDRPAPKNGLSFQAVFEMLEQFRKTESLDDSNEISYFQKSGRTILDGESILRSMGQISENAKKISGRLAQAESAKDQFFLKQELVNQQEILRKIVLRGVRMCENESAVLPAFTADAMNVPVLRTMLDHLTQGNWSNVDNLAAFDAQLAKLKETFYRMITPPAHYLRSILDELNV